jgi:UDP-N-acetyl-D-galactosamine dehydrogenase
VTLTKLEDVADADCIIVAVAHNEFKALKLDEIKKLFNSFLSDEQRVLIDVKGLYDVKELKASGLSYWRL